MAKRKVLIIIDSLGEGGAQRIVADIIMACSDVVDFDLVALYWFDFESNYYDMLKNHCKSIRTLCHPTRSKLEKAFFRTWAQLTRWHYIRKIIKEGDYNLIHTHMIMANQLVYPIRQHFPNLPVVGTYHSNFDHKSFWYNRKTSRALEQHDHVFCDIEAGYKDLLGVFSNKTKLEHLEFGINHSYYSIRSEVSPEQRNLIRQKYGIPVSASVLCSIARINFADRKIDQFIQAFATIAKEIGNAVLIIVGTGTDLPSANKMVATLGITDKVLFLGHRSELHELYAISDIYLSLTCHDDIGVAGKQAIVAGLPTFTLTMKPSTLGSGRYFSDAIDSEKLAKNILDFWKNEDNLKIAKIRSKALIESCNRNNMIERHREIYCSLSSPAENSNRLK